MINTSKYLEKLIAKVNIIKTCYYEEAPKGIAYPYLTLTSFNASSLDYGELAVFDIEIWYNEYTAGDIDSVVDDLRNGLDKTEINYTNYFTSHLNFEGQTMVKDTEFDLICRRVSFTARIFYK